MEPDFAVCHSGRVVLFVTLWMAFHPDLKGLSTSLAAVPAEG